MSTTHTDSAPGTHCLETLPLRRGHIRVLCIAALGQIMGAGLSTQIGIILPLMQLSMHTTLSPLAQGIVGCASLVGITIGSIVMGHWSERRGYVTLFRLCPALVLTASIGAWLANGVGSLTVALLLMGIGIGGEYSLDSSYVSEIMPRRWRLWMVGATKAAASLGYVSMALVSWWVIGRWQGPEAWQNLLLLTSVTALVTLLLRIAMRESPGWLLAHDRRREAVEAAKYFLGRDVTIKPYGRSSRKATSSEREPDRQSLRKIIFTGMPWACEGLGIYGIGVFTPLLLMHLERGHGAASQAVSMEAIVHSVEMTTGVNVFILIGFALGLICIGRFDHIKMQVWGFVFCAIGLTIMWLAYRLDLPLRVAIGGLMIFELFINAGPHLLTFIMPTEVYPVSERSRGAGVAAAMGKMGAIVGVLLIPQIIDRWGLEWLLVFCIATQLTGACVTATLGRNMMLNEKKE